MPNSCVERERGRLADHSRAARERASTAHGSWAGRSHLGPTRHDAVALKDDRASRGWRLCLEKQLLEMGHLCTEVLHEVVQQSLAPLLKDTVQPHLELRIGQAH